MTNLALLFALISANFGSIATSSEQPERIASSREVTVAPSRAESSVLNPRKLRDGIHCSGSLLAIADSFPDKYLSKIGTSVVDISVLSKNGRKLGWIYFGEDGNRYILITRFSRDLTVPRRRKIHERHAESVFS